MNYEGFVFTIKSINDLNEDESFGMEYTLWCI